MATIESSGFGLRRASSSCFGPPPLLLQLVLASRGDWEREKVRWMGKRWQESHEEVMAAERIETGLEVVEAALGRPERYLQGAKEECKADGSSRGTEAVLDDVLYEEESSVDQQERADHPSTTTELSQTQGQEQATDVASNATPTSTPAPESPEKPPVQAQEQHRTSTREVQASKTYTIRKATQDDIPQFGAVERSAGEVFRTVGLDALADDEPMPQEVLRSYAAAGHVWVAVTKEKLETSAGISPSFALDPVLQGDDATKEEPLLQDGPSREIVVGFLACFPIVHQHYTEEDDGVGDKESEDTAHFHIAELSVHTAHQKRGLGRRLLAAMFEELATTPRVLASGSSVEVDEANESGALHHVVVEKEEMKLEETDSSKTGRRRRGRRKVLVQGYSLTTYRHLVFNKRFYESVGFAELDADKIKEVVGRRGKELWDEEQASILMKEMRCWMIRGL